MKKYTATLLLLVLLGQATASCSAPTPTTDDIFEIAEREDPQRFVQAIRVTDPTLLRADVSGRVTIPLQAEGMERVSACTYMRRGDGSAGRTVLTPRGVKLDRDGKGHFTVDMNRLPYGPVCIQIFADNTQGQRDIFELQLYNVSRKATASVAAKDAPVPDVAKNMTLDYVDDFDGPLSISADGRGARYNAHKPKFGDFSGWPFSDPTGELNPFEQRDTYLVIHARKPDGTHGATGLIAPVDMDGNGYRAAAPFYMDCRFIAHSAPGTWPAFWTVTNIERGAGDELDVVEAYGGWGEGNPNSQYYFNTSHFWGQNDADGKPREHPGHLVPMTKRGDGTSWSEAFHTYGLYVDSVNTIYYLDNEETWRHPTNSYSYEQPHVFLINYAIGGASGWKIDLERYGNASDMYVDFVRVFTRKE